MVEECHSIVLLSIHPSYVESIIKGTKKVEFRKKRFARPVHYAAIYATSPVQKVVAFFRVGKIEEGDPEKVWEKYKMMGGIDLPTFQAYYQGTSKAVVVVINDLRKLHKPLSLRDLNGVNVPPQSYSYIAKSTFNQIMNS